VAAWRIDNIRSQWRDIRAVGDMKAFRQTIKPHYFSLAFNVGLVYLISLA